MDFQVCQPQKTRVLCHLKGAGGTEEQETGNGTGAENCAARLQGQRGVDLEVVEILFTIIAKDDSELT